MPKFNVYLTREIATYRTAKLYGIEASDHHEAFKQALAMKLIWVDDDEATEVGPLTAEVEQHKGPTESFNED